MYPPVVFTRLIQHDEEGDQQQNAGPKHEWEGSESAGARCLLHGLSALPGSGQLAQPWSRRTGAGERDLHIVRS